MIRKEFIPNILTLFRVLITPVCLYFILSTGPYYSLYALILFIIASLTDLIDGWYARKYDVMTEFGKFLDPLADKILVMAMFIVFGLKDLAPWWMIGIILFRDIFITLLRSVMIHKGESMNTSKFAKKKTGIQMFMIYLILFFLALQNIAVLNPMYNFLWKLLIYHDLLWVLMLVTTMITLYSGILYIFENKHVFAKKT
ncbi:MAG: CDP-diacylglycerol--glycerol-3-phosphate 3-phosphatidyltransferase [Candidatus Marinimicrobia bacterium]|nr:CDP-diacylglycerol--glycerol-3-phosphate 3-phosphatidyltransferase [Candidatus Neomarinimicrobiota bacterium]